jgi:hypothetical protein
MKLQSIVESEDEDFNPKDDPFDRVSMRDTEKRLEGAKRELFSIHYTIWIGKQFLIKHMLPGASSASTDPNGVIFSGKSTRANAYMFPNFLISKKFERIGIMCLYY